MDEYAFSRLDSKMYLKAVGPPASSQWRDIPVQYELPKHWLFEDQIIINEV